MEKKAEYQISSSVNEGILEIVLTGEVANSDIEKLTKEVTTIKKENNLKYVLEDVRAIKGRFGHGEAFQRIRNYPPDIPNAHVAIVDLPEHIEFESFQEIMAFHNGLLWKQFTDIDVARNWLKSKQEAKVNFRLGHHD
jgi:hypothetical protein